MWSAGWREGRPGGDRGWGSARRAPSEHCDSPTCQAASGSRAVSVGPPELRMSCLESWLSIKNEKHS